VTAILTLNDVSVHFGGVRAVDEVSMVIERGKTYGLVGPNGSGKSTLLGAISCLTPITRGVLTFDGTEYSKAGADEVARMGLGRTFQTVRTIPSMTVLENVMLGGDVNAFGLGVSRPWFRPVWMKHSETALRDRAREALAAIGLSGMEDRHPETLSYGNQRRVEIARALVSDPQLLLLDEPTAGMTSEERSGIAAEIRRLRGTGLTQILVDHDVDMVVAVADHMFVMNNGKLIASGVPAEIVRIPDVQEAYLGKRNVRA